MDLDLNGLENLLKIVFNLVRSWSWKDGNKSKNGNVLSTYITYMDSACSLGHLVSFHETDAPNTPFYR